jgi:hypothetical protein
MIRKGCIGGQGDNPTQLHRLSRETYKEIVLRQFVLILAATVYSVCSFAKQPVPDAVIADPPPDAKFPARMEVIHVPSGDVKINGVVYVPSGPGPHPAFVFFHGLPGNEKNLDLAQAVRRVNGNGVDGCRTGMVLQRFGSAARPSTFVGALQ